MTDGRMLGSVTKRNIPKAFTPSSRAASMMSSGMALIDADRIVMANPAWIQIITTMRKNVFHGESLRSHCCGEPAEPDDDLVEQPDLLDAGLVGAELVDELPDDRGADERDRHRQEDQRLGQRLCPGALDKDRVEQADRRRHEGRDHDPEHGVAQDRDLIRRREDRVVVVEPDEGLAGRVEERLVDRLHSGVQEPDAQHQDRREQEDVGHKRRAPALRPARDEEHDTHHGHEQQDREQHRQNFDRCVHPSSSPPCESGKTPGRARGPRTPGHLRSQSGQDFGQAASILSTVSFVL